MRLRDLFFAWAGSFSTLFILSIFWLSGLTDDEACTVERIEEEDDDGN